MEKLNVAILGAGGLGKNAAKIIGMKKELRLVGICDSRGFAFDKKGLEPERIANAPEGSTVGKLSKDPIGEILRQKESIDGMFVALPNLPAHLVMPHGYVALFQQRVERRIKRAWTEFEAKFAHLLHDFQAVNLSLGHSPERIELRKTPQEFAVNHV